MSDPQMDSESWSELFHLREEIKGPDGFATWKDAAVSERVKCIELQQTLNIVSLTSHNNHDFIVELMPLAKFGAMVASFGFSELNGIACDAGVLLEDDESYAPNIEATITKLLKGE